ncbi:unnamed protein product [Hanseniaspora opuntiae]
MKLLTTNFIKCSVKACDASVSSFPLRYDNQCEIELNYEEDESIIEKSYQFLVGILDKIDWDALLKVCADLGNNDLPPNKPLLTQDSLLSLNDNEKLILKQLFNLLINTEIVNGSMKCDSCEHVYMIKNDSDDLIVNTAEAKTRKRKREPSSNLTPLDEEILKLKLKYPQLLIVVENGYSHKFFCEDGRNSSKDLEKQVHCRKSKFLPNRQQKE